MKTAELIAMLLYFELVISIGVYFFFRDRTTAGEKAYFLGGTQMNASVAARPAGA